VLVGFEHNPTVRVGGQVARRVTKGMIIIASSAHTGAANDMSSSSAYANTTSPTPTFLIDREFTMPRQVELSFF
jgi:hypothetical protein